MYYNMFQRVAMCFDAGRLIYMCSRVISYFFQSLAVSVEKVFLGLLRVFWTFKKCTVTVVTNELIFPDFYDFCAVTLFSLDP